MHVPLPPSVSTRLHTTKSDPQSDTFPMILDKYFSYVDANANLEGCTQESPQVLDHTATGERLRA